MIARKGQALLRRLRGGRRLPATSVSEYLAARPSEGQVIEVGPLDGPPVYRMKNVVIHSDPSILLVTADGRLTALEESVDYDSLQDAVTRAFLNRRLRSPERRSGEWVNLNTPWAGNLWHWLFECLPKVILTEAAGFEGRYLIPADRPFVAESMNLLGIEPDRLCVADGSSFRVETLYVSGRLTGAELLNTPILCDEVRQRLLAASPSSSEASERLYISRRKGRRALVNDAEVDTLIAAYGFRKVHMEDYSLKEQIGMMRSCHVLLAPHGAGMAHVLFMPPGSLVLELFSPSYVNPTMLPIIDRFQHRYFMIPSYWNSMDRKRKPYIHGQDIEGFAQVIDITLRRELPEPAGSIPTASELPA